MSVFEPWFAVCSLSHSLAESFCVEILDPEVVLDQVETEWDCYMPTTIYMIDLAVDNHMHYAAM